MDKLARGYGSKNGAVYYVNGGLNSQTLVVIKLPDSRILRIMSRSVFIAMLLLALPSLISMINAAASSNVQARDSDGFKIPPGFLHDLVDEGLIKRGEKGFILGDIDDNFEFLRENGIDLLTGEIKVVEHQVFDFVFALQNFQLIDGILKDGGLVISLLGSDPLTQQLNGYKIVYLRRFENTVVVMKKVGPASVQKRISKQMFWGVASVEEKKAALKGLEDVYLEPPRRSVLAKKSRKIKFLPDLLKDPLDEYPRRVFVSDDFNGLDWFYKNYPMRGQEFQVYDVAGHSDESSELGTTKPENWVSDWLAKCVRREDYVVMKAEAQVVEEMLKENILYLVDELFLECKNQWQDGEGSKRAYWQCLALYGKVRDEGIAVHQWWG